LRYQKQQDVVKWSDFKDFIVVNTIKKRVDFWSSPWKKMLFLKSSRKSGRIFY